MGTAAGGGGHRRCVGSVEVLQVERELGFSAYLVANQAYALELRDLVGILRPAVLPKVC